MKYLTVFGEEEFETKTCRWCKQEKTLFEFPKHSQRKDGYETWCRGCVKTRNKQIDEIRKTAPEMSPVCECCGKKPNKGPDADPRKKISGLVLDHDAKSLKFRGWLCDVCNKAIGSLGDDVEGLMRAVNYLNKRR